MRSGASCTHLDDGRAFRKRLPKVFWAQEIVAKERSRFLSALLHTQVSGQMSNAS